MKLEVKDRYPTGLFVGQAVAAMPKKRAQTPPNKVYRQYVFGNHYLQFDRRDGKIFYGYLTCTDCEWQRVPMTALYDGNHFYVASGLQDDLYIADGERLLFRAHEAGSNSQSHGLFGVVMKAVLEGRNISVIAVLQRCESADTDPAKLYRDQPDIRKIWANPELAKWHEQKPRFDPGGRRENHLGDTVDVNPHWTCEGGESIARTFVATTDDFVDGERRSVVEIPGAEAATDAAASPTLTPPGEPDKGSKLREAQKLRDEGLISEEEFQLVRKKILGL